MDKKKLYPIESDVMFSSVMRKEKACIQLLQMIFPDKEIARIEYLGEVENKCSENEHFELEVQKFLQLNPRNKSIRLDLYFKDSNQVYNIEMQKTSDPNLPRRARMYSSLIDANLLEKSMEYEELINSYVIFLCTFDPFDRDRCIYTFESTCREDKDLCENNGHYNIYLNTKGTKGDINFDMRELFKYINGGATTIGMKTKSELVRTIDAYVREFNSNNTWRHGIMTFELLMRDNYKKGVKDAEAKAEARIAKAEARAEAKAQKEIVKAETKAKEKEACTIKALYAKKIPLETIAECTNLSLEEVNKIISAR